MRIYGPFSHRTAPGTLQSMIVCSWTCHAQHLHYLLRIPLMTVEYGNLQMHDVYAALYCDLI